MDDRDRFIAHMNEDQPIRPANILNIVAINQGRLPLTAETPTAPALDAGAFAELAAGGHVVVDARSSAAFGAGHVPGAFNIQVENSAFEQRVGWVTPLDAPLLLVLDDDEDAGRAMHKLAFIGLDSRVRGFLAGGMGAWTEPRGDVPQISVEDLRDRLAHEMQLLDVRPDGDFETAHIEGAHHMDLRILPERVDELGLEPTGELFVVCEAGQASSTACGVLLRNGFERVRNVVGGMRAWNAAEAEAKGRDR